MIFMKKDQKSILPGSLKRGPREKHSRFPEGVQKERIQQSPPDLGGGMFAIILPGGDVCQLLVKIQPKAGKRPFVCEIKYFLSKIHKQNDVCQILGAAKNGGKHPFLETYCFGTFLGHQFWPPQTSPDSF